MNTSSNKIGKWSVIIGIVIVLNLFFNYALSLIYKSPDYLAYCPNSQVNVVVDNQTQCVAQGGQWNGYEVNGPKVANQPAGYCDLQYTCRQTFDAANKVYSRNVFATLVILGAIILLIGNFMKGNAVIASGLSIAGVFSFIIASMRYWGEASDGIRVVILAIALLVLFWIAYKKFKNNG